MSSHGLFLNGIMLAGVGASVIPLVLHLLNRARGRSVTWGAMLFLQDSPGIERASGRWQQRGILALRTAAIALLAIAFARPHLPDSRTPAATGTGTLGAAVLGTTALVLVIDGSPSMTHPELSATRFELARRAAAADLAQLRHGDQAALIELGGGGFDAPLTGDLQSVASRLASLAPLTGSANLADGIRRAGALLRTAEGASRVIHLIADRQRTTWIDLPTSPLDWRRGARVFATPVGSTEDQNVSIESIQLLGPVPLLNCPAQVRIRLRNWSDTPVRGLDLHLSDSKKERSRTPVEIGANATISVELPFIPTAGGSMVLTARIDPSGISSDDQASLACDVLPRIKVLILAADSPTTRPASTQPLLAAADYVRLALTAVRTPRSVPFDVSVSTWITLRDSIENDADVIILGGALPTTAEQAEMLQNFVLAGGGLLIAPPANAPREAWQPLSDYGPWPLPEVGGRPAGKASVRTVAETPTVFGPSAEALSHVAGDGWAVLKAPVGTAVVARLSNGNPFAVTSDCGDGRVLTLAAPLDLSVSDFPRTSAFLPAIQNAVRYLTGDHPTRRNVSIGTSLETTIDHPADKFVTIWRPDGRADRQALLMNGTQGVLHYTATDMPGRYVLVAKNRSNLDFVVQPDAGESNLSLLDDQTLNPLLKSAAISRLEDDPSRAFVHQRGLQSMELGPALLALAAGCLVLEAWLSWRSGPRPVGAR